MLFAEFKRVICVTPQYTSEPSEVHEYQWTAHFPLPFPLPTKCFSKVVEMDGNTFRLSIHKELNRTFAFIPQKNEKLGTLLSVLHSKKQKEIDNPHRVPTRREAFLSVAVLEHEKRFSTPEAALENTSEKIDLFLRSLGETLLAYQVAAPFTCGWMIYPPSVLESRSIFVNVMKYEKAYPDKGPNISASCPVMFVGSNLQSSLFEMELSDIEIASDPLLTTPYELLAQAMCGLQRGTFGLAIVNAVSAVEILAESISRILLEQQSEEGKQKYDQKHFKCHGELKFRLHAGMKMLNGRSLFDEDIKLYQAIVSLYDLRNEVVHAAKKLELPEAEKGVLTCCKITQWLAKVAGKKAKKLYPKKSRMKDFRMTTTANTQDGFYWEWAIKFVNDEKNKVRASLRLVGDSNKD